MSIYALADVAPRIAATSFIAPSADIIGDVTIGENCSIWFNVVMRADGAPITVGDGTNIQDGTVVHISSQHAGTFIGNNVLIGHSALIHGCTLEDRSFVGFAAQAMDGCVIESDAMLAAGGLLTPGKRIPARQLWAGRPAKYMRDLSDEDLVRHQKGVSGYQMAAQIYRTSLRRVDGSGQ
jgi:gamma-carbonic anhydrase